VIYLNTKYQPQLFQNSLRYLLQFFRYSILSFIITQSAYTLNLDQYLIQVKQNNENLQANELLMQSGFIRSEEGFLMTAPRLIGKTLYAENREPFISRAVQGDKTKTEVYNIGITKKFTTGTNVKFEYDNTYFHVDNVRSDLVNHEKFWLSKPIIALEQPLFRDWLGKETKALINLKNTQMQAQGHASKFIVQNILMEAKTVYWDLASILANIKIKQEAVARSKTLFEWAKKRAELGLGNDSDKIQAKSALLQRELELQALQDFKKNKARLFNALRNIQSDAIDEKLDSFDLINVKTLMPKDKKLPPAIREDLKVQYQHYLLTQSQANIAEQNIMPQVNLNLTYYPIGRDMSHLNAMSEAWRLRRNTFSMGVTFDVPLDYNLNKNLASAYKAEKHAAELALSRKQFEVTNEWQQLAEQFDLLYNQLQLSKQLEITQSEKLKNEELLLKNGRTSTFQVIQFEQDYLSAQSQYYTIKNRLLNLAAAMELFTANKV
jgi:outer membrane protein TolC